MMASIKLDSNKVQRCAFCKHWYDVTNEHIKPQDPKHGYWKFDPHAHCMCLKRNLNMAGGMRCDKFECKIES